jgi:hypothetical protein
MTAIEFLRWFAIRLGVGIAIAGGALGLAVGIDAALDTRWTWPTLALVFLALGAFGLLTALSQPGLDPPGTGFGMDAREAYIDVVGREVGETFSDYRAPSGGLDALVAMLPSAVAFVVLLSEYGIG